METHMVRGSVGSKITEQDEEKQPKTTFKDDETPKRHDLTTCEICNKDLFAPKNFPCLHSFCEMCITDYVKRIKREKKLKGHTPTVACPICETPATFRSVDNPKEFAESLQTSTLSATLLSKKAEKSRECSQCPSVQRNEATFWCFYCAQALCENHESYHKTVTSSKVKHQVFPIKNIRDVPDSIYKSQHCRYHEKNPVVHFCMDHLNSCCSICWKRMHKVCNVIPIDQAARIVHKSRITSDLQQTIDHLLVKVTDTLQEREDLLKDIQKQRNSSMKAVKMFRKDLDKYIDSLQSNLELDIENHFCQTKEQFEREIHDFENKRSNFEHYLKLIKSINECSQPIQSLSELTDIRFQCNEIEESIGRTLFQMKNSRLSVTFISIQQIAHVISKLGSAVITETSRRSRMLRSSNDSRNKSRHSTYNSSSSRRSNNR
ncbi:protein PML-like [Mytilus trossulus]|uniref:protein PML-like n=1 Tax=Mytilus trossulus TaxID=6551 RepID=UPI003004BE54